MNCAVFALARATNSSIEQIEEMFLAHGAPLYRSREEGAIRGVRTTLAAEMLLPPLGFHPWCVEGGGRLVYDWAASAVRVPIILSTGGHAMLARNGLVFDNQVPDGLPAAIHPYGRRRVKRAIAVFGSRC